jgi:hypothetical protein
MVNDACRLGAYVPTGRGGHEPTAKSLEDIGGVLETLRGLIEMTVS